GAAAHAHHLVVHAAGLRHASIVGAEVAVAAVERRSGIACPIAAERGSVARSDGITDASVRRGRARASTGRTAFRRARIAVVTGTRRARDAGGPGIAPVVERARIAVVARRRGRLGDAPARGIARAGP